jgi:methylated-DNA-[protein]-cysteine S-methyltransferase
MTERLTDRLTADATGARLPDGALERFRQRAAGDGLVDIAYARVEAPFGDFLAAVTPRGLVRLAFLNRADEGAVVEELAGRLSPRVLHAPERLDDVRHQLDEYFAGERRKFDLKLDRAFMGPFSRKVLARTARIPYGGVSTYMEVATGAGSPRAYRAAGNALANNPIPIVVPCHRVLATGGGLGGYGGGLDMKRWLLDLEGAEV